MKEQVFEVKGMTSGSCEKRVENTIMGVNGVLGVTADAGTGAVTVKCDDNFTSYNALKTAIRNAGYQVIS